MSQLTIDEVVRQLNDGLERTTEELERCKKWLLEYQKENNLTIEQLNNLCWRDSDWVFNQIF